MACLPSESSVGDWISDHTLATQTSASSQSTQTSVASTLDAAARPDPMHVSIANSWSSYLSAQHQSREVGILRRATNENFKQVDISVASLQRDLAGHEALVTASVNEFRARSNQIATQLTDIKPLQESVPSLQQDLAHHKEHTSKTLSDLNQRLMAMQQSLEGMHSTSSKDLQAVQGQYRSALEKIEFLQGELREMREEKISTETKLAALERKVATDIQPRQEIPAEKVAFLDQIHSRHDDLMKLLNRPTTENQGVQIQLPPVLATTQPPQGPLAPPHQPTQHIQATEPALQPDPSHKRKREESPPSQSQSKRAAASQGQNLRTLYYQFKKEFDTSPPKSEVKFIWRFIDAIGSPEVSRHVQESLVILLPGVVSKKRETRRAANNRHVNISATVTWKNFIHVLGKVPALY